ncbi:TetR/AcrR family transcriptional regulator [Streptomyces iconiensis]|uniref:TetR family transcriptional regulator n=1 Tax=Streptomyces iconiensis TaxID=1384038 RepID=A0ABT6ZXJ5_9ACTN|nr:TetR family transcriptional regulator [Streptomyces iconiensis]MDJ1133786.1 TetR family transcriptional regulator [Streptomyces iconiensis]
MGGTNTDTDTGAGTGTGTGTAKQGGGLRERKKRETRELISDRATDLFIERGFEATTVAEIADAARVAKKTVTNYFPRKEDLALDHHEEFTGGFARTVAEREPGESALEALCRAFLTAVERHDPVIGFSGEPFARMIADSPTLVARLRDLHEQREDALAATLVTETGAAPDDITPRAAAAQLAGTHRALFRQLMDMTLEGTPNSRMADVLKESAVRAFGLLEPSLGDYARTAHAHTREGPPGR